MNDLKKNETGVIKELLSIGNLRKKLMEMGVLKGVRVKLTKVAPLGDPIEIEVKNYRLSLRKKEAGEIILEE
ncbi:MAG: ferrous iron transport protein A [Spirochaetes bacterium]|nr:ferrous iron transport protein A [Spirochaetota bacterium]MCK5268408.1 ferrous iron transport protein A [Spirochaetota bacterium]